MNYSSDCGSPTADLRTINFVFNDVTSMLGETFILAHHSSSMSTKAMLIELSDDIMEHNGLRKKTLKE